MRVDVAFAKQLVERLLTRPGPPKPWLPDPRFSTLTFTRVRRSLVGRLVELLPGAQAEYTVTNQGTTESVFEHAMYLHLRRHGAPNALLDRAEANRMISRMLPAVDLDPYVPPHVDEQQRVLYVVHEVREGWDGLVAYEANTTRGTVAPGKRLATFGHGYLH